MRCLSVRRNGSVLTDVDQGSRVVDRRRDDLPVIHRMWFHPTGCNLGYRKSAPIGNPSELFFLSESGRLLAKVELPNAISEIVPGPGVWYIGCRNSRLYAFDLNGKRRWQRQIVIPAGYYIPGIFSREPAPYLNVGAGQGLIGVAAGRRLCAIDEFGRERWKTDLPRVQGHEIVVSIPSDVPSRGQRLSRLGLPAEADQGNVHTGYLRFTWGRALAPGAFVREVESYDWPKTTPVSMTDPARAAIEVVMSGGAAYNEICSLVMGADRIAVGSTAGKVELFDYEGNSVNAYRVGNCLVAVTGDGRELRASYAGGKLTLFSEGRITGHVQLPEYFAELVPWGADMVVWRWSEAWVVDRKGRVIWRATFSKRIVGVIVHPLGFDVLAGKLFSFHKSVRQGCGGAAHRDDEDSCADEAA